MKPDYADIVSILKFLHQKTIEDGGDGTAIWLTKFYNLEDIINIIKTANIDTEWTIEQFDNFINWHNGSEEGIIITNDKNTFNKVTDFIELRLELH